MIVEQKPVHPVQLIVKNAVLARSVRSVKTVTWLIKMEAVFLQLVLPTNTLTTRYLHVKAVIHHAQHVLLMVQNVKHVHLNILWAVQFASNVQISKLSVEMNALIVDKHVMYALVLKLALNVN